jgi:hypothetical protein
MCACLEEINQRQETLHENKTFEVSRTNRRESELPLDAFDVLFNEVHVRGFPSIWKCNDMGSHIDVEDQVTLWPMRSKVPFSN